MFNQPTPLSYEERMLMLSDLLQTPDAENIAVAQRMTGLNVAPPEPQNWMRNEATGKLYDLGPSLPQGDIRTQALDYANPIVTSRGKGYFLKGDPTTVVTESGAIVRYTPKVDLAETKQLAEIDELKAKAAKERAEAGKKPQESEEQRLYKFYLSMPEGPIKEAWGQKHGFLHKPTALEEKAAKEVKQMDEGKRQLSGVLEKLQGEYETLKKQGAAVSPEQGALENIAARAQTSWPGQLVGGAIGTETQTTIDKIQNLRPLLMQQIKKATGMTGQEINSNTELQFYLQAATDPTKGLPANLDAIQTLDSLYGLGLGVKGGKKASPANPQLSQQPVTPAMPKSKAEYDALPQGAQYIAPNGQLLRKK